MTYLVTCDVTSEASLAVQIVITHDAAVDEGEQRRHVLEVIRLPDL